MKTAYDFNFKSIDGGELKLSDYKGKVLVITNVASRCGFTNQYEGLQTIWDEYKDKNVVVIGCLLYTSPSPRDRTRSRMPSSA